MKAKILISILAVALVCGCVVPGLPEITPVVGAGRGLEITSFTAEPSTIFSGATVRVIMEVENQGGSTVPKEDSLVYLTGSNVDFGSSSDMVWHDGSEYDHLKDMKAADVVRGLPADTDRVMWSLESPTLPPGQTRTDTFIGRIYEEYETAAHGSIWVYTETEADAARAAGRGMNKATFTYTTGPIGLEVSVQPDPVVMYGGENSFSLYIKLTNLATGTIYKSNAVTYTEASEDITLTQDDLNLVDIDLTTTGDLTIANTEDCEGEQELIAGKSTTIVCDLDIAGNVATFKSFPVDVSVKYGYYTQATATVTVQGR
jgi:hypothetical protein